MQGKALDIDFIQRVKALLGKGMTQTQAAERLNVTRSKVSRAAMQLDRLNPDPEDDETTNAAPEDLHEDELKGRVRDNGDGTANFGFSGPIDKLDSLEKLVERHIDLEKWEIEKGELGFYEGYRKDVETEIEWEDGRIVSGFTRDSGKLKTITMFRGFVRLRYRATTVALEALLERLEAATTPVEPRQAPVVPQDAPQTLMALLSAQDVHWGKLAHRDEAGSDYDIRIASQHWYAAVGDLVGRLQPYSGQIDTSVIVIGSDALHTNDTKGRTIAGTPVDVDSRWYKAFDAALEAYIWAIDQLLDVSENVHAVTIPGNHGGQMEVALAKVLKAHYRNEPRVLVDDRPKPRKIVEFGQNLLVFQHHIKGGTADAILAAVSEWGPEWGRTLHHEIHTDHLHHKSTRTHVPGDGLDVKGTLCRISPALCPPDAWHYENGFVGSAKGAQVFLYDDEVGHVATFMAKITPRLLDDR